MRIELKWRKSMFDSEIEYLDPIPDWLDIDKFMNETQPLEVRDDGTIQFRTDKDGYFCCIGRAPDYIGQLSTNEPDGAGCLDLTERTIVRSKNVKTIELIDAYSAILRRDFLREKK